MSTVTKKAKAADHLNAASSRKRNKRKGPGFSSRHKGVFYEARCDRWRALLDVSGCSGEARKRCHLGYFKNEDDAARAYNKAAFAALGDRAILNEV